MIVAIGLGYRPVGNEASLNSVKIMGEFSRNQPQFQLILSPGTGHLIGRIYFPKVYVFQHTETVKSWLEQKKIYFT